MLHFCQDYVVNWYIVLRGGRRKRKYDRGFSRICLARPGGSIAVPEPLSNSCSIKLVTFIKQRNLQQPDRSSYSKHSVLFASGYNRHTGFSPTLFENVKHRFFFTSKYFCFLYFVATIRVDGTGIGTGTNRQAG